MVLRKLLVLTVGIGILMLLSSGDGATCQYDPNLMLWISGTSRRDDGPNHIPLKFNQTLSAPWQDWLPTCGVSITTNAGGADEVCAFWQTFAAIDYYEILPWNSNLGGTPTLTRNPATEVLPVGRSPRTLCSWLAPWSVTGYEHLFSMGSANPNRAFFMARTTDKIYIGGWGNDYQTPQSVFSLYQLTHFCVTYDGMMATIYTNGGTRWNGGTGTVNRVNMSDWNTDAENLRMFIGRQIDNTGTLSANFFDLRLYNRALTEWDVNRLWMATRSQRQVTCFDPAVHQCDGSLILWYSGKSTMDVLHPATVTLSRTTNYSNCDQAVGGRTGVFSFVNNAVYTSSASMFPPPGSPLSVCAWGYTNDGAATQILFSYNAPKSGSSGADFFVSIGRVNGQPYARVGATDLTTSVSNPSTASWNTGFWNYICIVYTGDATKGGNGMATLYYNGGNVFQGTVDANLSTSYASASATIGGKSNSGFWTGSVYDVSVYNRVITQDEVFSFQQQTRYNTRYTFCPAEVCDPLLKLWLTGFGAENGTLVDESPSHLQISAGNVTCGLYANGINDVCSFRPPRSVSDPAKQLPTGSTAISVCTAVFVPATAGDQVFWSIGNSTIALSFGIIAGRLSIRFPNTDIPGTMGASTPFPTESWNHVCMTYQGGTNYAELWVNGGSAGIYGGTVVPVIPSGTYTALIGQMVNNALITQQAWTYDLRVYAKLLTTQDINNIYQRALGGIATNTGTPRLRPMRCL
eukprot:TRINITY_DN391_c0_g1_i1.p1 TRINITY_DN391_c0_g1~~TRINITY_DN391_c0_g1_i1.p1  ORF type:complete len:746 (-),score=14.98 TRINITY_DN391_c0_g1_i1:151-2388(-)